MTGQSPHLPTGSRSAGLQPGGQKSGSQKSGSQKSGSQKSGSQKSGSQKSGSQKSGGPVGTVAAGRPFARPSHQKASSHPPLSQSEILEQLKVFIRIKTLEAAIPGELKRSGEHLTRYERIGGLTNKNYKLHLGNDILVLRLPGRGTGRFINRAHERSNQYKAASAGFSPQPLYFSKLTGVKISTYLQGAQVFSPCTVRTPGQYQRIARFLREFHESTVRFDNNFNGFAMARTYERIARARFCRFYDGYKELRPAVFAMEELVSAAAVPQRACHNDLVPENILEVEGRLQLIDWEYSGMNDPAWDIASFLLESEFDASECLAFLMEYARPSGEPGTPMLPNGPGSPSAPGEPVAVLSANGPGSTEAPVSSAGPEAPEAVRWGGVPAAVDTLMVRVKIFMILQDFLWSLWSLLQAGSHRGSDREAYYQRYGEIRFERAGTMIAAFYAEHPMQATLIDCSPARAWSGQGNAPSHPRSRI
jgi:thiamine kinase-like enzyme